MSDKSLKSADREWRVGEFIATRSDLRTRHEEPWKCYASDGVPGLVVHPTLDGWRITHENSGLKIADRIPSRAEAKRLAAQIGALGDWTRHRDLLVPDLALRDAVAAILGNLAAAPPISKNSLPPTGSLTPPEQTE